MSAAEVLRSMGATVALVDGKLKLAGLDRLRADVAERVQAVARARREELVRELSGASAPGPDTGLEWSLWPAEDGDPNLEGKWAVFDLRDVCRSCGLRIVRAGERILAAYPPSLDAGMVEYSEGLLDDARGYLAAHLEKLPALAPAEAVEIIKDVMRQHRGLKFTRGENGSRWPIYPPKWAACQKQALQSLWLVAGDALDADPFMGVDSEQ